MDDVYYNAGACPDYYNTGENDWVTYRENGMIFDIMSTDSSHGPEQNLQILVQTDFSTLRACLLKS